MFFEFCVVILSIQEPDECTDLNAKDAIKPKQCFIQTVSVNSNEMFMINAADIA